MSIQRVERDWDRFGRDDPMFSILTHPGKEDGWDLEEFRSTGVEEVDAAFAYLRGLGLESGDGLALDFGCGIGRLTQALAPHFTHVWGVDIASSMIAEAERLNRFPEKCGYVLNRERHLRRFSDSQFDFVYSLIVLQHMRPRYSRGYLAEMVRVLSPGGIALIQLPEGPIRSDLRSWLRTSAPRPLQRGWFRLRHGVGPRSTRWLPSRTPVMELYWVPRETVRSDVEQAGGQVLDVVEDDPENQEVRSVRYCITKP